MKQKVRNILLGVLLVALIVTIAVFTGNDGSRVENLFKDTVKALDNGQSISELFNDEAREKSTTLDADAMDLAEFYQGKSVEIKDYEMFHESGNTYRAYAQVVTDNGSYFLCISATGSRLMDQVGIKQLIIEDYKNFAKKNIFKKKTLVKYEKKAEEFGVTIRLPGDNR